MCCQPRGARCGFLSGPMMGAPCDSTLQDLHLAP
jgi:hypothetical protein